MGRRRGRKVTMVRVRVRVARVGMVAEGVGEIRSIRPGMVVPMCLTVVVLPLIEDFVPVRVVVAVGMELMMTDSETLRLSRS